MIEIRLKNARFGVLAALVLAPLAGFAQPKSALKPLPISAPPYRTILQKALDGLQKPRPGAVAKIIAGLDTRYAVKRGDGQIQAVSGNFWSRFGLSRSAPGLATPSETRRAREALQLQIRALDAWTRKPLPASTQARQIVLGLAASGEIRVGPLWWQKILSDAWTAIKNAWISFRDWLNSLFPSATPFKKTASSADVWLWRLFYALIAAILAAILWYLWRTFGAKIGRRDVKGASELQNEDAALLQLPPAELLSRAERFAAQGNFREALRHRFLSLLLDMDARGVWRYDARRTNWEHIAALNRGQNGQVLAPPLADLTRRFDRVRYGGAACDDAGWRQFDAQARDFETLAASGQKSAAREVEMAK